jgi:hypothetical protein
MIRPHVGERAAATPPMPLHFLSNRPFTPFSVNFPSLSELISGQSMMTTARLDLIEIAFQLVILTISFQLKNN